ncbi:hypothetical protein ACVW17_000427 [Bradyrhizobium sp. USDA 4473]
MILPSSIIQASPGAGRGRGLLGQHLREQRHALDVAPFPADVGHRDDLDAGLGRGRVDDVLFRGEHDQRRLDVGRREREIAAFVGAAGYLEIDHAVDEVVALDQLLLDLLDPLQRLRQRQLDLADRTFQPRQMRGVVDQLALEHRRHLIDAVGEQETAVEHRDLGLGMRHVRAVDVSDLFHASSPADEGGVLGFRIRKLLTGINPLPTVIPGRARGASPESISQQKMRPNGLRALASRAPE